MARFTEGPAVPRAREAGARRLALACALAAVLAAGAAAEARAARAASGQPRFHETGEPTDLYDLAGWLEFKSRHHVAALPGEARLFHRRAILAAESGQPEEAERLMRGASELDPGFVAPHLALANWSLLRAPSQALLQYATVLELARRNFMLQLALSANALYLGLQALYLGLLAAGLLVVVIRLAALRHPWEEGLGRWLAPDTARWWALALIALPYLAGFGPVLPTLLFLGVLWPALRARERALAVLLGVAAAATPLAAHLLDRLAAPLDETRAPLHGVPLVENEPWSPELDARLAARVAARPDNPYLQFAHAWTRRQSGDAPGAEAAYRRVLQRWPDDSRTLNNLGNALAMQGRSDEALEQYLKAARVDPLNAAAWFNASQIYTQRYEYKPANDAVARASAIDFDLVKSYQAQGADGSLALADQWIAPRTFWSALREADAGTGRRSIPPSWRTRLEAAGWPFSAAALLALGGGIAWGVATHRATPLRTCSNCGRVVCRRCARRRRELALCPTCEAIETRAESPDFAKLLLTQYQKRVVARQRMVRTAVATVIPGFGLLARQRVITPVLLLTLCAALLSGPLGMAPPFGYEPRLLTADHGLPLPLTAGLWLLVLVWSLGGYVRIEARARAQAAQLAAPGRSRVTQATRRQQAA